MRLFSSFSHTSITEVESAELFRWWRFGTVRLGGINATPARKRDCESSVGRVAGNVRYFASGSPFEL